VVLVLAGFREAIVRAVPLDLKLAIGVGIGIFIALVGLRDGGIVINDPATGIGLGDLTSGPALISLAGVFVAAALAVRGARGAILAGIATTTILGLIFGILEGPSGVAEFPKSSSFSTIGDALDPSNLADALTWALVPVIFALFMTDFFDTVGTATAVTESAGLTTPDGGVPRLKRLLLVDSAAAAGGGAMGVSSVTTYVESGAGVAEGARTGLASLVTAGLFLLTIFFVPLIALVGQGVVVNKVELHPATAPALVMVGYLMIRLVGQIDWSRAEGALPAFFVIIGIPLTFSIAAGIGLGIFGYVVAMLAQGRARQVHPLMWALVPMFAAFYASDWLSANVF
jgi:AGZA family xanthine/uracil permease-like MFS transporter